MPFTNRQLFLKCFWWSLIVAGLFVGVFLFVISTASFFRISEGSSSLVDGVLYASVLGNLIGAGLVGWRVVDKYHPERLAYWLRRYITLCIISLVAAFMLLLSYSVLGVLLMLWGFLAAWLVLQALSNRPLYKIK